MTDNEQPLHPRFARIEDRVGDGADNDDEVVEGPPTGEVRIAAVQAAIAAGKTDSAPAEPRPGPAPLAEPPAQPPPVDEVLPNDTTGVYTRFEPEALRAEYPEPLATSADEDVLAAFGIPDWTDPPTGQVPRVLLEDPDAERLPEAAVPGPTWREDAADWDDLPDHLAYLAEAPVEGAEIAGREPEPVTGHDLYGLAELDVALSGALPAGEDETAWGALIQPAAEEQPDPVERRRAARRERERPRRVREAKVASVTAGATAVAAPRRSPFVATATGCALGIVALACILGGAASSLVLAVVMLELAAAEVFGALRRGGFMPATIVGLLAIPALAIGAYEDGTTAVVCAGAATIIVTALWAIAGFARREPLANIGVSLLVICWVGILGAFAGLLLGQGTFAHRGGVDLFFAALVCTIAHDVGSYIVGSRLGRHHIAPRLSPGKTLEGLLGGTVLAIAMAVGVVWRIAPFTLGDAIAIAVIVAVLAPFGDLFESLVKRDLQLKDMGSVLPGHGGVFDRIDALLFVLPATYYLARLVHFG